MLTQVLLLIVGLVMVVAGADFLVDGASSIARKAGISEFVIGLTIVAIGTSAPEMVVSFMGAFQGNADISIGNIFGSNIFNTLLILGLSAVLMPIGITKNNLRADIPINIIATVLVLLLGLNGTIFRTGSDTLSRIDGIVLLVLFIAYMVYSFKTGKKDDNSEDEGEKTYGVAVSIILVIAGLASLILGGEQFVN